MDSGCDSFPAITRPASISQQLKVHRPPRLLSKGILQNSGFRPSEKTAILVYPERIAFEEPGMPASTRFKLSAYISAVKMEAHPGSTLRSPTSILVEIPADSVVELEGPVARSGLINVLWNGDAYSVFYEDFEKNTRPLEKAQR
jgi:hypothetical protein